MLRASRFKQKQAAMEALTPQLEAQGYTVFHQPPASVLPPMLQTMDRPDAVAIKEGKKLAIEIVSGTGEEAKINRLSALFANQPNWELRLIYAPLRTTMPPLAVIPRKIIERQLEQLPLASEAMGMAAGLLMAWSLLEAAARSLVPDGLGRPQPPAEMVELLAFEGYVTPDEADSLRRIAGLRNQAAHGMLDVPIQAADVNTVSGIARILLAQHEAA